MSPASIASAGSASTDMGMVTTKTMITTTVITAIMTTETTIATIDRSLTASRTRT